MRHLFPVEKTTPVVFERCCCWEGPCNEKPSKASNGAKTNKIKLAFWSRKNKIEPEHVMLYQHHVVSNEYEENRDSAPYCCKKVITKENRCSPNTAGALEFPDLLTQLMHGRSTDERYASSDNYLAV